jgi:hypothetical protein
MQPSTAFSPSQSVAILCVGEPKAGKTRLAFSLPKPGILDCDGNMASAVRAAPGKLFQYSQPFIDDKGKEVPESERWTRACQETKLLLSSTDTESFVLDGLSNLCRWGLIYAEAELVKAGINIRKEYLAKYQAFIPLLSNYIAMLRIPKKLVLVTVHQLMDKDELTGAIRYKLDIPGRLADNLGGQFTDVIAMTSTADPSSTVGAKYVIRTKPTGYHVNLGTSLDLAPSLDITGKTPDQIWAMLSLKISYNVASNK